MSAPKDIQDRVKKLRKTIDRHRYLYHVLDKEEISPEALDSLKYELQSLEEKYPELKTKDSPTERIAGKPLPAFKKVSHKVPQWSFHDAFTEEDVLQFDRRVKRLLKEHYGHETAPTYTSELKIDGLKIVLTYRKGMLHTAATRGDGKVGEDVTHNVKTIESVPLRMRKDIDVIVEGEIWLSKKELERINKKREKEGKEKFANPRNAAAGSIRQLDPKIAAERRLDSFIYDLAYSEEGVPDTQEEELALLLKLGFKVNQNFATCRDIYEVLVFWKRWQKRAGTEAYMLDGVVVKVNEKEYQEALGYTGKAPRFACALKFPAEQVTTVVEDIVLQVGRTGVLTPVAHLSPVHVAGSRVSRATLHNEDEIRRLDVRVGDTVVIQKAGDVIPDIVRVVGELRPKGAKPYEFPAHVGDCGGDGAIERVPGQAAYRCVNKNSFAQKRRILYHFVSKKAFNIEGLGPKIMDALLDHNLISSREDIFTLEEGDITELPGFKEKATKNLLSSIEKSKKVTLPRFLFSLSIDQVGEETAEDLADEFGSLGEIMSATKEELEGVAGVGPTVAESIYNWFRDTENTRTVDELLRFVAILPHPKKKQQRPLEGKVFVLTGTLLELTRDEAKAKIKNLGARVTSSVSQSTDYVVAGRNPGSKYDRAKKLGVKILDEEAFFKIVERQK